MYCSIFMGWKQRLWGKQAASMRATKIMLLYLLHILCMRGSQPLFVHNYLAIKIHGIWILLHFTITEITLVVDLLILLVTLMVCDLWRMNINHSISARRGFLEHGKDAYHSYILDEFNGFQYEMVFNSGGKILNAWFEQRLVENGTSYWFSPI